MRQSKCTAVRWRWVQLVEGFCRQTGWRDYSSVPWRRQSRLGEKEKEQSEWVIIGISNVIRKERERERERGCLAGCMGILFSIQLAGDSRNTRRVLYPGSSALLHGTTYAVCSPVMLIRGVLHVFQMCLAILAFSIQFGLAFSLVQHQLCLVMLPFSNQFGLVHMEILVVSFVRVAGYNIRCLQPSDIHFLFIYLFFLCVQLCLVMLADWLAQQVMGLLTQLLVAIGCTKEECLQS